MLRLIRASFDPAFLATLLVFFRCQLDRPFDLRSQLLLAQRLDWIQLSGPVRRNTTGGKAH
jgi:hypothetical protein